MSVLRHSVVLALLALVAAGCRLTVGAEVVVDRDGSGSAALVFALDGELVAELDALDVDPTAELTAAVAATPSWELSRERTPSDGLVLTLRRSADEAQELTDAFRELTAGLSDDDPALVVDLDLDVDAEGAAELSGEALLRPPVGPGEVVDDEASAALIEQVRTSTEATLTVELPGPVTASDADGVDGRTLTWKLPVDEPRSVSASASAPTGPSTEVLVAIGAGVLLVLAIGAVTWALRRRR